MRWLQRSAACPTSWWGSVPLLSLHDGSLVYTATILAFVREAAEAVCEDVERFDSHSLRISGATDLHQFFGVRRRIVLLFNNWGGGAR